MSLRSQLLATCCVLIALLTSQHALALNTWPALDYNAYAPEQLYGYSRTWKDPGEPDQWSSCVLWDVDPYYGPYCAWAEYDRWQDAVDGYLFNPQGVQSWHESAQGDRDARVSYSFHFPTQRAVVGTWVGEANHAEIQETVYVVCGVYYLYVDYPQFGCENLPQGSWPIPQGSTWNDTMLCTWGDGSPTHSVIDDSIVALLNTWPSQEPFERAFRVLCGNNNVPAFDHFNDSFGQYWTDGGSYTDDPCKTFVGPTAVDRAAGAHQHPYFHSLTEFHAHKGCLNNKDPSVTIGQVNQTNSDNEDLSGTHPQDYPLGSVGDMKAIADTDQKSIYLRTPTAVKIVRRDFSTETTSTQVWP